MWLISTIAAESYPTLYIYIIFITNSIFAIRQLQHDLQRWSLINIPRKKNTRRTRDRIIDENNVYLVLTKTNSLLYLLQAYLWSTSLVILAPPLPLITLYREQLLPWFSPVSYLESRGHQRVARSFYEYLKWLVFVRSPRKKGYPYIISREVNEARQPHTCSRPCAFEEKKNDPPQGNPAAAKTHNEIHSSLATATASRRCATKHALRVRPYSAASIDPGFVEIGLVQLSQSVKTKNITRNTYIHADRQTGRQTDWQADRQTDRQTDRQSN